MNRFIHVIKRPLLRVMVQLAYTTPVTTCGVHFQCSPLSVNVFVASPAGRYRASSSSDSTMTDRKAVIKNADMSEDMQQDAVDCATQAMEKYNIEKDIAAYIKKVRQDGCMDESKCSLHHGQIHSLLYALVYFWSLWGGGSCDQNHSQVL